jgi:N-acetylglucosamine malate deacetylase 1
MSLSRITKNVAARLGFHPRRSFDGAMSYSRYLGYIRPKLLELDESEFLARRRLLASAWEPRKLIAPVGARLLVISPHPDDESIGPGGLLLAHRELAEIHLVCLCDGSRGGSLPDGRKNVKELGELRRAEFEKAATALNATSVTHLNLPDGNVSLSPDSAAALYSIVKKIEPDVVLLPWFLDGHIDHRSTNVLYARACGGLDALVLGYEIWSMLEPNAFFDFTQYAEAKSSLIGNYPSQLRTVDYIQYASGLSNVRAFQLSGHPLRRGSVEAFIALPNREYCELVVSVDKRTNTRQP